MTRGTIKKLMKPLDEPEREFCRHKRAAWNQQQHESLTIAERNLFDDEASSSNDVRAKTSTLLKILKEHSLPSSARTNEPIKSAWNRFQDLIRKVPHHGIQKWLLVQIFHDNISPEERRKLDQFAHFYFSSLNEEEGWNRIEECVHVLKGPANPRNPYLICDICGGAQEADECDQNRLSEQVCLSRGDIYDDPSLLRSYQNNDIPPWGNSQRREEGEVGLEWVIRSKFEDELSSFMLKKKFTQKD
ncbi:hypothetical protein Tco_1455857 [Tanacetum coccineum]